MPKRRPANNLKPHVEMKRHQKMTRVNLLKEITRRNPIVSEQVRQTREQTRDMNNKLTAEKEQSNLLRWCPPATHQEKTKLELSKYRIAAPRYILPEVTEVEAFRRRSRVNGTIVIFCIWSMKSTNEKGFYLTKLAWPKDSYSGGLPADSIRLMMDMAVCQT